MQISLTLSIGVDGNLNFSLSSFPPNMTGLSRPESEIHPKYGETELHSALRAEKWDRVDEILKQGHSKFHQLCSCINWDDVEGTRFLLETIRDVDFKDMKEITPLRFAVLKKTVKFAKMLIQKGADLNAQEFPNILPILGEAIQDYQVDYNVLKSLGTSVLQYAAPLKSASIVKFLLQLGTFDVNHRNKDGHATLHGTYTGRFHRTWIPCENAELLLKSGARLDVRDKWGRHPSLLVRCLDDEKCPVVDHFKKLTILGYKIEDELLGSLLRNSRRKKSIYAESEIIQNEHVEELEKLKKVVICVNYSCRTLFDLLFLKKSQLVRFAGNDIISELYQEVDEDFEEKYPHFGFALNRVCKELKHTRNVLMDAKEKFYDVTGFYFCDPIVDKLFSMLDYCDLEVFCKIEVD